MFWIIIAGFIAGIAGGMGLGGGTLLIPLLRLLGVEQEIAQGANLLSFIPMALIVLALHEKNGLIKAVGTGKIVLFAIIGCIGGAVIGFFVGTLWLKYTFAVLLLFSGIWQIVCVRKKSVESRDEQKNDDEINDTNAP
ncbi:MAG: sulfite exporter TauE/SafE family protein [Clostridia bacterium]|nr:sulfite exporter TauE/SafE family protein [Clostridia bacterium]